MKTKKITAALVALACTLTVGGAVTTIDAHALDTGVTVDLTYAGAYLRVESEANGGNGIKFTGRIEAGVYSALEALESETVSVDYGVMVVAMDKMTSGDVFYDLNEENVFGGAYYDILEAGETQADAEAGKVGIANIVSSRLSEKVTVGETDYMEVYGSVTNIDDANLTRAYVGKPYVKITDGENVEYIYDVYTAENVIEYSRSLAELAIAGRADAGVDASIKEWLKVNVMDKLTGDYKFRITNHYLDANGVEVNKETVVSETGAALEAVATTAPRTDIEGYLPVEHAGQVLQATNLPGGKTELHVYYQPAGMVFGNVAGLAGGEVKIGGQAVATVEADGFFEVKLPYGEYDMYYANATHEGLLADVVVSSNEMEVVGTTAQKLTQVWYGADAASTTWSLTKTGEYTVETPLAAGNGNAISFGALASGVNMATENFAIEVDVKYPGYSAVMFGLAIQGTKDGVENSTAVWGMNNLDWSAQPVSMVGEQWPAGYMNCAVDEGTEFNLRIEKIANQVNYYINDQFCVSWWHIYLDFTAYTNAKVGFGFYRMSNAVFSNYKYIKLSSPATQILQEGGQAPRWRANDDGSTSVTWDNQDGGNHITGLKLGTHTNFSTVNFTIEADVKGPAFGANDVFTGLLVQGFSAADSVTPRKFIYGLNNASHGGQMYQYNLNNWAFGSFGGQEYDHTNYHLTITKEGNIVSILVNGTLMASLDFATITNDNLSTYSNVDICLGVYRSYNVTFSNITYTSTNA